ALEVPPTDDDLGAVGGDVARYGREVRPGRVRDAIGEIRDLGTEADVWAVAAPADAAEAEALGALVREADRDAVAVLARPGSGEGVDQRIRAAAAVDAYRGLVLDPET